MSHRKKASRLYEEMATELILCGCTGRIWPGGERARAFQGKDRLNQGKEETLYMGGWVCLQAKAIHLDFPEHHG